MSVIITLEMVFDDTREFAKQIAPLRKKPHRIPYNSSGWMAIKRKTGIERVVSWSSPGKSK